MNNTANDVILEKQDIWERVRAGLRECYGEDAFNSWLKPLYLGSYNRSSVSLCVPTRFIRDWVERNYKEKILSCWRREDHAVCEIELVITNGNAGINKREKFSYSEGENASNVSYVEAPDSGDGIGSPLDGRFTFDNFVVGKPNEFAFNAVKMVAESEIAVVSSNPLFLRGGVGLGKTHLMHSAAWHIRKYQNGRKVIYLSAEKFMYRFINALRAKNVMSFKEHFRSADVLMIDDVQFIGGKDGTQEEFFHTFNSLIGDSKQLIISADRSPSELKDVEDRIKSRLNGGLVVDINATNFELRLGILQAKAKNLPFTLPEKVLEFLAEHIRSNVRELEGSLNKVAAHALYVKRAITIELVEELLADLLLSDKALSVQDIQKLVAEHYDIKVTDLCSAGRRRNIARPRQIAMYLAKHFTAKSFPEIGRQFGGKDHTTVMHAVRRIDEIMKSDKQLHDDIQIIGRKLKSGC